MEERKRKSENFPPLWVLGGSGGPSGALSAGGSFRVPGCIGLPLGRTCGGEAISSLLGKGHSRLVFLPSLAAMISMSRPSATVRSLSWLCGLRGKYRIECTLPVSLRASESCP